MRARKWIAIATVTAVIATMPTQTLFAQEPPPPAANEAVAQPKHHKKSFFEKMKGKVEKTIRKRTVAKRNSPSKKIRPAKSAGPSPDQIQ